MFIRKKKNKSGSISVQIIDTSGKHDRLIKSIGSSKDPQRLQELLQKAHSFISRYTNQEEITFEYHEDKKFMEYLKSGLTNIQMIGPELILGKIYDQIGFNKIDDILFRHLVISRLVFPLSKLKTSEYLMRYQNIHVDADQIYRYLDKLENTQKEIVEQISFDHTLKLFNGNMTIVFYDVTTIYFEASDEDELRKTGFSKDGKHQCPQIILGLLVSIDGYPLAYEVFEGNKFEGHTIIPVIEKFKKKYSLEKLVIIADAGMLSKNNMTELLNKGYEFILGGRIKNEPDKIKNKILSHQFKDGKSIIIDRDEDTRLVVAYSSSRAKKDIWNRQRGLTKLEKSIQSGKLNKQHINNRGYNKYLKIDGDVKVAIDYEKFVADQCWDGLKGYITNSNLTKEQVIKNYKHLWQVEKAFRISKTDLRVRPIYHRLPTRISAHITIAFCAYKLYKELERQLKEMKSGLTPAKAIDIMKTIYRIVESTYIDTLGGIEEIKSFNTSSFFAGFNKIFYSTFQESVQRLGFTQARLNLFAEISAALITIGMLLFGAVWITSGKLLLGEMMAAYSLAAGVLPSINRLISANISLQSANVAAVRLMDMLLVEIENPVIGKEKNIPARHVRIEEAGGSENAEGMDSHKFELKNKITIEDAGFSWNGRSFLFNHINIEIPVGRITSLWGPSGAGKSTLVQLLERKYPLTSGNIKIDGTDANFFDLEDYRKNIGVLPQQIKIFNGTLADNILVGRQISDAAVLIKIIQELNLVSFLQRFEHGLYTLLGENGRKLSGGEMQILALIRALLEKPKLLVIDEGLSGVDIEIEELIYKLIKEYSKENAVFLITHNLTNLAKTDYLYIMRNGKIEEEGKPEILLQNGSSFGLLWKRQNISLIEKGILANG